VEAHAAVIHRVLADRASRPHLADLAELEATVNLVTRLLKGPVLPDPKLRLHGAIDVLTVTMCSESNKYANYVSKTLGRSSADADMMLAASDDLRAIDCADRMWRRFISVRSMVLSVQRVLVNKGLTKFTFASSDGVVGDERPTVHLFGTVVMRLSLELSQLVDARRDALKSIDHYKILRDGSVNESDLLARLAQVESDIRTIVISTENALEVLYAHLQPPVHSGDDDSLVAPSAELNGGKARMSEFGVLASFMLPGLQSLIQYEKSTLGLDTDFINLLARRVRDSLETSAPFTPGNRFGIA
jgi:nuclear pore complex protein Nup205